MGNLSIVLCTYNEVNNLEATLDALILYLEVKEIIIVDDNSTDGTIDILEKYNHPKVKFRIRKNIRGFASAFIDGVKLCKGDYILRFDVDMFKSINIFMTVFKEIKDEDDCIIFSRYIENSSDQRSKYRRIPSLLINKICRILLYSHIKDYTSCIVIFKRNILSNVFPKNTYYANFIIDFIFELINKGFFIREVPFIQDRFTELNSKSAPDVFKFLLNGLFYFFSILRCFLKKFKK